MRNAVIRKAIQDKPVMLIGSHMCGPFSTMNNLNYAKMIDEEKNQRIAYGRKHLEICARCYELQWREGRNFLHEHPQAASSWQEREIQRLLQEEGVNKTVGDRCRSMRCRRRAP